MIVISVHDDHIHCVDENNSIKEFDIVYNGYSSIPIKVGSELETVKTMLENLGAKLVEKM